MTTYEKIVEAIKPFHYPYAPDLYKGDKDRYFTYNYVEDRGEGFADDEPFYVVASVQVHFYMPADESFTSIKKKIRNALFKAGFTYPEITVLTENDTKKRHIIFECDIEEEE